MWRILCFICCCSLLFGSSGCSKKQVLPSVLTGVGAATVTSGVIYRASIDDADHWLGDSSGQKAAVASLLLSGTALMITGVILAAITPLCEKNADCWAGNVCEKKTQTCVPQTAVGNEPKSAQFRNLEAFELPQRSEEIEPASGDSR